MTAVKERFPQLEIHKRSQKGTIIQSAIQQIHATLK